jgi:hypothetical protein
MADWFSGAYPFSMHEHDRFKLLFGPYRTPRFKYGDVVTCEMRGDVKIVGLTAARILWPKCRTGKRSRAIILYGALAEAVRRESAQAVEYWWGVGSDTVWKWRKALGVDRVTEGTTALLSRWAPETIQSAEANRRREPTLKSPERAAKIAAKLRGKPRPKHVIKALIKANKGRKLSGNHRRKMSEAHKRRGTIPPAMAGPHWTSEEDALLGTMKDRDVAARIGRSESAVSERRYVLGVAAFTKRAPRGKPITWTPAKDRLLGTMSDANLARKLQCSPMTVFYRRRRLKIPAYLGWA